MSSSAFKQIRTKAIAEINRRKKLHVIPEDNSQILWVPDEPVFSQEAYDTQLKSKLEQDFPFYAQHCLKIRTKSSKILPLQFNNAQKLAHVQIERHKRETGRVRVILLKGRQQGMSTYIGGRFFHHTSMAGGLRSVIMTHEAPATQNLFDMVSRYLYKCPEIVRPQIGRDSAKELNFPLIDSGYKVGTAGNRGGFGRSDTIQRLHASEFAFWPNAETHLAGVFQAVPEMDGTEIIIESTANGVGGVFHDKSMEAHEDPENSEYLLIFIPWYIQEEYKHPLITELPDISPEELELKRQYNLTIPQLSWRRSKIKQLKSVDTFKQEYPFTVTEAFLFSGRSAFDTNHLEIAEQSSITPKEIGDLINGVFKPDPLGKLKIWEQPNPGRRYSLGCDVSEGLVTGDFSSISIVESTRGRQVAEWNGKVAPDELGNLCVALGNYYRKAFLVVEANNHGILTLHVIRRKNYSELFVRMDVDARSEGKESKKIGFLTTSRTKPLIIGKLQSHLRDCPGTFMSKSLLSEMRTYEIGDDGSFNAREGNFDDRVMAHALAIHGLDEAPWAAQTRKF